MTGCAPHREFLAAIADGETELVPAATLKHVEHCAACAEEIRAHRLLTARLRQSAGLLEEPAPRRRRLPIPGRLGAIAAGVAAALLMASAGVAWFVLSRPDPVQAAVTASTQPLQIQSGDSARIGDWCRQQSGRELPAIQLDGMQVVGARMDRIDSTDIVTVAYSAPSGARVTVSWLEGQAPAGSGVEDRTQSGHEFLVVHSAVGAAVVMGASSDAMWETAAAIESA